MDGKAVSYPGAYGSDGGEAAGETGFRQWGKILCTYLRGIANFCLLLFEDFLC